MAVSSVGMRSRIFGRCASNARKLVVYRVFKLPVVYLPVLRCYRWSERYFRTIGG